MNHGDLEFIKLARGICPDCGGTQFRPGPRGGLAQNIECRGCLHRFNVTVYGGELVFAQRIEDGGFSWDGWNYVMLGFPPKGGA